MAKVVFLCSKSASLTNFRRNLILEILSRGHSVHALIPDGDLLTEEALHRLGVTPFRVALSRTGLNPFHDMTFTLRLSRELKRLQPDVVFSYTIKPVIFGSIAARLAQVPHIFSMITGLGYAFTAKGVKARLIGFIAGWLYRIGLSFNEGILFQNDDDPVLLKRRRILPHLTPVTIVNGSGVDLTHFTSKPLTPHSDGVRFLMIARLVYEKGIREFVEAARTLRLKYPTARFQLLGGTEERLGALPKGELDHLVREGVVEYLGEKRDVRPDLAQAHVFVLPSYREGTPRTVLEALATGRAIVTTDAPGCRQTIRDKREGFLVPVQDAATLSLAMEEFLKNPSLISKMGTAALERARERYDVTRVNAMMIAALSL